jgi:ABC-type sugar transport system substrate-binding protein
VSSRYRLLKAFAAQGVSGIVLAPLDNHALVRPVEDANVRACRR